MKKLFLLLASLGPMALLAQDTLKPVSFVLDEFVLTDFRLRSLRESASDYLLIQDASQLSPMGLADIVSQQAGIISDISTGEVFSRVFARGISLSAEDDIGWYYSGLLEDGLPVTAVQYQQFSPDFFIRPSIAYDNIEVLKGGKSSILGQNAPGMLMNLQSRSGLANKGGQLRMTTGIHASSRAMARLEGYYGSGISAENWSWDLSYLYRYDRGARKTVYDWSNGGMMKAGVYKTLSKGVVSLRLKALNDMTNRHMGIAATDWTDPEPVFGQDFRTTSLLPPSLDIGSGEARFRPQKGIRTKEYSAQFGLDLDLGEWDLVHKSKYSNKSVKWASAIGGQRLGLENFLSYFVSGDPFPAGLVEFKDVQSGEVLALVNNLGSFAVFQGLPPSFEYVQGQLPFDAILGNGSWSKNDKLDEFISETRLSRKFGILDLTAGMFYSQSKVDIQTKASFIYSTYESSPRALSVRLVNPGEPARELSDSHGLSNYDALFYQGAAIDVGQWAGFLHGDWTLSNRLRLETGLRYQIVNHEGTKDFFAPDEKAGGQDGNPLTSYDNSVLKKTGEDPFDFNYDALNYSFALGYSLSESSDLYMRHSLGHKIPELNYYINTYSNIPVDRKGDLQKVRQSEIGYKYSGSGDELTLTAYLSTLNDVPFSEFFFDDQTNQIFFTPIQLNSSRTYGIEASWLHRFNSRWLFQTTLTWQNAKSGDYTLYQSSGTLDTGDDFLIDFSGNALPHIPKFMSNTIIQYQYNSQRASVSFRYMGNRFGNIENSFEMPAYYLTDLQYGYDINKSWRVGILVKNVFNDTGIVNFFGPNEFGSNANAATTEYIQSNPKGSFVVFPVMPRSIFLSLDYSF